MMREHSRVYFYYINAAQAKRQGIVQHFQVPCV